jgi:hypothetical protein
VAGVLIAVAATAIFPMIICATSSAPMGQGAVCHHKHPLNSSPMHRSHQCCVSEHQWAIPGSPLVQRPVIAVVATHHQGPDLAVSLLSHDASVVLSFIGAYTFGGVRDLIQNKTWQMGLGGDVTFYSKPASLDAAYGNRPVSFQIFALSAGESG